MLSRATQHIDVCNFCGRDFELSKSQAARHHGNKYCSPECVTGNTAGLLYPEMPEWGETLLLEAKKRAKRKSIDFSITENDMRRVIKNSGLKCEISGIAFQFDEITRKGPHRPFSPSLDRKNSNLGYTPDNIRIVCVAVNIAMNTWGEEVLIKIAYGMLGVNSILDEHIPKRNDKSGLLPGVKIISRSKMGPRFGARYRDKWIGYFDREIDAHLAYKKAKRGSKNAAAKAV